MVIYFTFPETKGYSLEEIDRLFESDPRSGIIEGLEKGAFADEKASSVTGNVVERKDDL